VSFFDDEPDEPTRVSRPARPRRAASGGRSATAEPPDVARRRLIAFGVLAVVVILMILFVRSCSSNAHKNALKDYNRDVAAIAADSDAQSKQLFQVLNSGSGSSDVRVAVSQVRLQTDEDASRAKALSPPGDDEAKAAQRSLELVMNLRAAAVTKIADLLPKALSNQGSNVDAINQIAGQMQAFLASDVVYSQRVAPLIQQALDKNDIHQQNIPLSKFLPSIGWLDAGQVGDQLNPDAGVSRGAKPGQPKPGTHGHGLVSVTAGETTLQPSPAVNHITASTSLPLDVVFANQGQNTETNVKVTAKLTGGPRTVTASRTLNQTEPGKNATLTLQLSPVPPKGTSTVLQVTVAPVPGEKKTDNNTQKYTILFG